MPQFSVNYAPTKPEKPRLKPFLLLALAVAVVAFCATLLWR